MKRSTFSFSSGVIFGCLALGVAATAHADTIYDDLATQYFYFYSPSSTETVVQSFSPSYDETLTGLDLALSRTLNSSGTGTLSVGLYSINGTTPTFVESLGTISDSTLAPGEADYSVPLLANPILTAGTYYYVGLSDNVANDAYWFGSLLDGVSGPLPQYSGFIFNGSTAGVSQSGTGGQFSTAWMQMAVFGTPLPGQPPVPDQSETAPLLALGAASLALFARKSKLSPQS